MKIKILKVIENNYIQYETKMVGREYYQVEFIFKKKQNQTELVYQISFMTESKLSKINFSILSLFYKKRQQQAFSKMCKYLETKLLEISN